MSGSGTLSAVSISALPVGPNTLSAGMQIPLDDPNGGGPGVLETVRRPGSDFMATSVSFGGVALGAVTFNPAGFSYAAGTFSLLSSGAGLTVGGVAVQTADPTLFTATAGVLGLKTAQESTLGTAGSLTGAMQIIVFDNGVAKLATLSQIAAETAILTEPAINLSSIGSQATGQPFQVIATLANYLTSPVLSYADDGAALGPLPAGATVSSSSATFTHPGLATGTHTVLLEDGLGFKASASFAVAPVPLSAAVLANVPANGLQGQPIGGVTVALTPSYATGYAVLSVGGADEGARQAFTGTAVPALTPAGSGLYALVVYAALTGGAAIFTSSVIAVAAVVATGATLANIPASGHVGVPISGITTTLTPANATAYASLYVNGADQGQRIAFSGTSLPALTPTQSGQFAIRIYAAASGGAALATSATFPVTLLATGATIAGAPASGTQGQPISGLTDTITPAGATGYAVLYVNGADEGARQAFTGLAVPALTPQGGGNYLVKLYAANTGGSALATSAVIPVTVPATAANLAGVPSTGSAGTPISGITLSLTPSTASAFAVLTSGGVEQGARVAVSGGALPSFTPASAGSDTLKIFAAAAGGTALFTSPTIAISGAQPPAIGTGQVAAVFKLDASSGNVFADAALTTAQATDGGAVLGWKDDIGSYNFTQATPSKAAIFAASAFNGHPGIRFPISANALLQAGAPLGLLIQNATTAGANGLTIAIVLAYDSVPSNGGAVFSADNPVGHLNQIGQTFGNIMSTHHVDGGYENAICGITPAANSLVKLVVTFDPNTPYPGNAAGTGYHTGWIVGQAWSVGNNAAGFTPDTSNAQNYNEVRLGNVNDPNTTNYTVMEMEVWPAIAQGTQGTSPTGDFLAISNYLTTKWGS